MTRGVIPLYRDDSWTFRFADDRRVERIHLGGAPEGAAARLAWLAPRSGVIAEAPVGAGGWVELPAPLVVRAGEGFAATLV